jgi:hypothetical protein
MLRLACAAWLAVLSAPAVGQEPLVFGAIGDSGEVTPGLLGVVREMEAYRRDRARFEFVLMLGDNIYSDGVGRGIAKVFEGPFGSLLATGVQFYAVLGNHDIRRGTDLQIHYPAWNMNGRRFYEFSKGDGLIEFFALDSTALSDEATSLVLVEKARLDKERAALERKQTRTASSQARWKVVFLHHSIYSAATKLNGHGNQRSVLRLRALLESLFVAGRVDLVAHVTSDAIRIEAIGADGRTLDTFEVVKRPWPDSEPGGRNESPHRATTPAMTQSDD